MFSLKGKVLSYRAYLYLELMLSVKLASDRVPPKDLLLHVFYM